MEEDERFERLPLPSSLCDPVAAVVSPRAVVVNDSVFPSNTVVSPMAGTETGGTQARQRVGTEMGRFVEGGCLAQKKRDRDEEIKNFLFSLLSSSSIQIYGIQRR